MLNCLSISGPTPRMLAMGSSGSSPAKALSLNRYFFQNHDLPRIAHTHLFAIQTNELSATEIPCALYISLIAFFFPTNNDRN